MQDRLKFDLTDLSPSTFVSKWILERVPHVFADDYTSYIGWRAQLGDAIGVDPCSIALIGSSSVGVSLHPEKQFRDFGADSDIDVAVVSHYHFEVGWKFLRTIGATYYQMSGAARRSVEEHRSKYIYFGTIATDRILEFLPFGKEWLTGLTRMATCRPTEGREIKARIYRDYESLRGYHVSNVKRLIHRVTEE